MLSLPTCVVSVVLSYVQLLLRYFQLCNVYFWEVKCMYYIGYWHMSRVTCYDLYFSGKVVITNLANIICTFWQTWLVHWEGLLLALNMYYTTSLLRTYSLLRPGGGCIVLVPYVVKLDILGANFSILEWML